MLSPSACSLQRALARPLLARPRPPLRLRVYPMCSRRNPMLISPCACSLPRALTVPLLARTCLPFLPRIRSTCTRRYPMLVLPSAHSLPWALAGLFLARPCPSFRLRVYLYLCLYLSTKDERADRGRHPGTPQGRNGKCQREGAWGRGTCGNTSGECVDESYVVQYACICILYFAFVFCILYVSTKV